MTDGPRLRLVCALAAALALGGAPQARADAFSSVFQEYQKRGTVQPCSHSTAELKSAQRGTPPDIGQYAPDFPGLVAGALKARERGSCSGSAGATSPAAPATGASPGARPSATPPSAAPSSATPIAAPPSGAGPSGPPAGAAAATGPSPGAAPIPITGDATVPIWTPTMPIVLWLLAVAAAIGVALAVLARILGWTFERLVPARHQVAEAGYRASAVWGDFLDWVRLGR